MGVGLAVAAGARCALTFDGGPSRVDKPKTESPIGIAQAGSVQIVPADHPNNVLEMPAAVGSMAATNAPDDLSYMTPEQAKAKADFGLFLAMNPGMKERLLASPLGRRFAVRKPKGAANG